MNETVNETVNETAPALAWGHTHTTPYAKSHVTAVIGLPIDGKFRDELCGLWCQGIRTFSKAAFDQLTPECQQALRTCADKGLSSLGSPRLRGQGGTAPSPERDLLGDRIIEFIAGRTADQRAKWTAQELNPAYYAQGCQVFEIAAALGVSQYAVNGAMSHLLRAGLVRGITVAPGAYAFIRVADLTV
jgi:hypothetical protein